LQEKEEFGPELTMDIPFGQPLRRRFVGALGNKLVLCAWLLSSTLEILRLRLGPLKAIIRAVLYSNEVKVARYCRPI